MSMINNINRRINLMLPYKDPHIVYVQYVEVTKDGKYVLSYLEKNNGNVTPNFTEIINIDGQWYKSPFHLEYDKYDFEEFDSELSKKIINELPDNMKMRIVINDDRKKVNYDEESDKKLEINSLGAIEIVNKVEQDLYYVLIPNSTEDIISKEDYPYSFPFPAFSIEGKTNHINADYEDDTNKDVDFNELEFSRYGLSNNTRKKISEFLQKQDDVTRIGNLPVLELEDEEDKLKIHFINCPEITTFNDIYKAKSLFIDCDMEDDISISELFKRALNDSIPYYFESDFGTKKDNKVKHKGIIR